MIESKPTMSFADLLPPEDIDTLLRKAMSRSGDFAEVYGERCRSTSIPLEEHQIRSAQSRVSMGVGIRVISGERTGYAYSDNLDMDSLSQAADTASHIASGPGGSGPVKVSPSPSRRLYFVRIDPSERPAAEKVALLDRADRAAFAYDPRITQVDGSYLDSYTEIVIANSTGLWTCGSESMLRLYVSCLASQGGESRSGSYGGGGRIGLEYFESHSPEQIAGEAARSAVVQLDAIAAPAGAMPVVIGNGWGGVLFHEAVGHGLEADFNRKRMSVYSGRIGETVASALCTIADDSTLSGLRGCYNMDDEGTPGCRSVLIEKGVLRGYMTDYMNATLMSLPMTGNGRRQGYADVPIPRMSCFFMEGGESDPEEIIASVDRGVYARHLGGGQVDITSGNFVFSLSEGYLIEKGKLGAPIKGATLIGNGPDVLTRIVMVGTDLGMEPGIGTCGKNGQSVPTSVGQPTVKVSEMTVGGTAGD